MAIASLGNGTKLDAAQVRALAEAADLSIPDSAIEDWQVLLGGFEDSAQLVLAEDDCLPIPDPNKYLRSNIEAPADNNKGGWATRCLIKSTAPTSDLLAQRTVAVKDNAAVAGVRCTNGLPPVNGEWIPQYDATVVTRVLDAGGIVTGKAACENACMEPMSNTSYTGVVHNPYADGYTCGGSSSGSGRLVAIGAVDMAIGGDQGGSIRIPAAFCGIVGLKPTWGLVPYTGILGLQSTIDHTGPMTSTVRDNALMLEAIAGPDGLDDRQPFSMPPGSLKYSSALDEFLAAGSAKPRDQLLKGFKIGVLKEGFAAPQMNSNVSKACHSAISDLKELGAEVVEVSVPNHEQICLAWSCALPLRGAREALLGDTTGRKQFEMTDRGVRAAPAMGPNQKAFLSQEFFDALGPGAQNLYMRYLYVNDKYGAGLHAKCTNLLNKATQLYDAVLGSVDVMVMPTVPMPALPFPAKNGPLASLAYPLGVLSNTAQFNSTGHPALSLPVGFVSAPDNPDIKLPAGLQIVGKRFEDLTTYKIAAAWEGSKDWKRLVFAD
ncbi:Amidase [Cladophialophora carrionii]|uniref:Amidase n=1 Tax=Cladophialophora carrionii TaxID=86049 RepID=A0A1C1CGX3_9EURO|nr:Amidase [Cladophialophora carrionii]